MQWGQPDSFVELSSKGLILFCLAQSDPMLHTVGVSGIIGMGWHWHVKCSNNMLDGSPSSFWVSSQVQIRQGQFVVLSMTYPAAAQFSVSLVAGPYSLLLPLIPKFLAQTRRRKRGFCLPMKCLRGSYTAGGTSPEVKEYRAQLVAALKCRGVSLDVFLKANNETDFAVTQWTLYWNMKAINEGKAPLSAEKKSGHPAKLTDEQWDVVAGVILLGEKKRTCSGL